MMTFLIIVEKCLRNLNMTKKIKSIIIVYDDKSVKAYNLKAFIEVWKIKQKENFFETFKKMESE